MSRKKNENSFRAQIPPSLHLWLVEEAKRENVSLNTLLIHMFTQIVEKAK